MTSPAHDPWLVVFHGYRSVDEGRKEALCTLGNGYFATRGAAPESVADEVHYPGTYVAGCYNRLTTPLAGLDVEAESLVNLPNWLWLTFRIDDGPWFDPAAVQLLQHDQELNLRCGILVRRLRFRDSCGRTTRMVQRRFVHMGYPHLAALDTTLVAEDWSGSITFRCGIDGRVRNDGVARYRALEGRHLAEHGAFDPDAETVLLHARTNTSHITVAEASRSRLSRNGAPAGQRELVRQDDSIAHDLTLTVETGDELRLEKIVSLYTSRDAAISEPVSEAAGSLRHTPGFGELLHSHTLAWHRLWERFHCGLSIGPTAQQAARLHLFHLLQTVSPNTLDLDVGVPARGLHGEAYRGHIFWDELFVLPTITLRIPELTRSLLLYRYRRLSQARLAARRAGLRGALFPWQSGSNGREESQRLHLNPRSGRWLPDHTHLQRHIGIAIAYSVWQYFQASADRQFLDAYGAELILEITRCFASLAEYDSDHDRYVIRGIVGPDEYHTGYPGHDRPGIDNNAYTNIMTAWLCRTALRTLRELPEDRRGELVAALDVQDAEVARWQRLARKLFVPWHRDGIISQFEGYERLVELDWERYRDRYGDIQRLDRILDAEGDDPNRYKASKQADVLMLFYLLSAEELREILGGLGYRMPPEAIPRTIEYYLQRTSHGSTLSAVVHSWVLARAHRHRAVEFFEHALASDINDTQRGTTREGVHLAAMVGSVDLLQRCFAGIEARDDLLRLNPFWPEELGTLELSVRYRGQPITVTVTGRNVAVDVLAGTKQPAITVQCGQRTALLGPGGTARFSLEPDRQRPGGP